MQPSIVIALTAMLLLGCGGSLGAQDAGVDAMTTADSGILLDAGGDGAVGDGATRLDAGPVEDTRDPETVAAAFARDACEPARRCESFDRLFYPAYCHPDARSPDSGTS